MNIKTKKPKDKDRFLKYLDILQEKVPWDEKILLRISDHLYIVSKGKGERVVKCDCGHEFGDYRVNHSPQNFKQLQYINGEELKGLSVGLIYSSPPSRPARIMKYSSVMIADAAAAT